MAPRANPEQSEILRRIGLRAGEEARFRRADRGRWQEGRISWSAAASGFDSAHFQPFIEARTKRTIWSWKAASLSLSPRT